MTPAPDETVSALRDRLALLRTITNPPPPIQPARLARPGEVPAPAADTLTAARDAGWTGRALHAIGPAPYSWNLRAAGHHLAASISVRLRHPDGRAAAGVWLTDAVTMSLGKKVRKGYEGPRRPPEWRLNWAWWGGWTWTVCSCELRDREHPAHPPTPLGAREFRALFAPAELGLDTVGEVAA